MLINLRRAPNPLLGWGLSLLLLVAPAPAQLLTGLLGNDTGRLMVSDTVLPFGSLPAFSASGTADQPGSRLEVEARYDDVFRERGTVRRHDVNRWEHKAALTIPIGPQHGRLLLTYRQVQTEIDLRPFADQSTRLGSNRRQLQAGYGRQLTGLVSRSAVAVEATQLDGDLYAGYRLGLITAPWHGLRLALDGGWRFDGQSLVWRFEDQSFPGSTTYREDWLDLGAVWKPSNRLVLEASYGQGIIAATGDQSAEADIRFAPRLSKYSRLLGVGVRPGDGRLGVGVRLWSMVADGTGKVYDAGRQFGYLAELDVSERRLQLWVDRRGSRGVLRLQFDRRQMAATGSGNLEPWPFGDNIFDQLYTIYFVDRAELSLDRLELGFIRKAAGRTDWAFKLGYILVKSANRLVWQQRLFLIFFGEIHREELNLAAAELLVPTAGKTWRLGPVDLTYTFTQVIPIRVRLRREAPPGVPRVKTRKRGGGYHRLKLAYGW
ncbi:MAG: hypothetical protein IH972_05745 [Candidatus Marinimicrobia bacterium]|nr:hypothetical protein [Candidatus Neomarinimicrobiota bacterium]